MENVMNLNLKDEAGGDVINEENFWDFVTAAGRSKKRYGKASCHWSRTRGPAVLLYPSLQRQRTDQKLQVCCVDCQKPMNKNSFLHKHRRKACPFPQSFAQRRQEEIKGELLQPLGEITDSCSDSQYDNILQYTLS